MKQNQKRPTIDTEGVGMARYQRYHDAIGRYKEAIDAGFYIEAISLMESLITDRLNSLLGQLLNANETGKAIPNKLINKISLAQREIAKIQGDNTDFKKLIDILERIDDWRDKRNDAIHGMAQLGEDINRPFSDDYAKFKGVAKEADPLFDDFSNIIKKLRRGPLRV